MRKGQTTIEYLILVAVAIIIASIVTFAIIAWVPGVASDLKKKQSIMGNLAESPVSTMDGKLTNNSMELQLQNTGYDSITIRNISVSNGSAIITGTVFPSEMKLLAGENRVYIITGINCSDVDLLFGQSYQFDNYTIIYDVSGGLSGQVLRYNGPLTLICGFSFEPTLCSGGMSLCNNTCVNESDDTTNCGGCGVNCSVNQTCLSGVCAPICSGGMSLCNNTCVNESSDTMNCGGCGVTCSPSWTCVGGTCTAPPCNAECGNTINSSIVLNCSLSCGGTALKIGADSITLNCGGHAIGYAQTSTGYGINITNHNSVTIENCNITQTNAGISGAHAIYMSNADSSIIEYTNISVNSSGGYGISLSSGSGNNTITNNRIIDMNSYGIRVSSSSGNLLFNNLINATTPADADASLNYWNSTLTAGTNIIGGPYNGGNFYASLDGYGFSETCSANSTRICTSSYDMLGDVGGNNVDYLPLAVVVPPELLIINSSLNITAPYGSNYTTDLAGAINLTNFTGGAIVAFPAGTNGSVTVNVTTDLSGGSLVTVSGAVLPAGTNKTIFVPKLLGMDQICVNDNDSIVSISEGCNQSGEIFIGCPGSNGSISCAVGSDSYAVSGLNHSCVGEIYIPTITNSTPFTSATLVKDDNSTYPLASWSNSSYINVTLTCNDWAGSGCNFTQSSPDLASWADGGLVYTAPSGSAYYPSALYDSNGFGLASPLYKIWYSDGSNNAFVINSTDGINWNSNQTLSGLSTPHHVQVLYDINCFGASPCNSSTAKYRIWYWNSTYVTVYDIKSIATAESADGISWSNDTALSQSNSTPLVNTTNLGPNNWNQGTYGPASLFYNSTASNSGSSPWSYSYVMYYDATDGGREFLGLAYSSDGLNWTANSQSPTLNISSGSAWDNVSVSYCSVYRDENGYHMWYSGSEVSGANHGIGYAYSDDGISWTKDAGNPIFSISDGNAYRNSRTYTPTVVDEGEGMLRMFFTAFKSGDADKKIATAYLNYTGPVTINRSGATVMRYRSVDLDLSIENVRNLTVRLFSIAPYVSMSSPASNSIFSNGAINVTYAIGNANYKYAVVSIIQNSNVINSITSGNSSFISRFGVSANEVYNITVTVYDSKGNSATKTATNVTAG